jgi:hypothetical protein
MDTRIIILTLKEIMEDDNTRLDNRFSCEFHGWNVRDSFQIMWDFESSMPVLYFKNRWFYIDAPQGDDPVTFRQVLTYLGMPRIHMTMEQVICDHGNTCDLKRWTDDIMMEEIMESSVERGHPFSNSIAHFGEITYILEML